MARPCVLCESKLWQNNPVPNHIRDQSVDEKNVLIDMLLDKHYNPEPVYEHNEYLDEEFLVNRDTELIKVHDKFGPDKVWDIPYAWNIEEVNTGFFSKKEIYYKSGEKIRLCIYCLYVCYIDMYLTYDAGIKNMKLKYKFGEPANFLTNLQANVALEEFGIVLGEYWESGSNKDGWLDDEGEFYIKELLPPTNWEEVVDGKYSYKNTVQLLKEINIDLNKDKGYYKNIVEQMIDKLTIVLKEEITHKQNQEKKYENDSQLIVDLLTERGNKTTVSDIDAFLKFKNIDYTKTLCQDLFDKDRINFAGNSRYFVLTEVEEKPTKTSKPKSEEVDVEKELEKLKGLLDKGLITQEQYDAKSNELLGL